MLKEVVYLSINKGETQTRRTKISITNNNEILLGRGGRDLLPDVSFISQYISRRHALIGVECGNYYIIDLMSKHGTEINNTSIEKNKPFMLKDKDIISLAKGSAILTFHHFMENSLERTLELPIVQNEIGDLVGLIINIERREILIDGVQIYLTSKDTGLFWLLHKKRGCAVSYDEIKITVWPERILHKNEKPDVGREEINMLVYRLRKKLGKYGQSIVSVPRYGYMLDL